MSSPTAEVIAHSIGPNGVEIFTILTNYIRFIHSEDLRHRQKSHSVASSRAIPADKLLDQVSTTPAIPVLFPREHKGMQGTEVFPFSEHCDDRTTHEDCVKWWLEARDFNLAHAKRGKDMGISKQITNRLIENWVMCRDVITFTKPQIEGFMRLRHPWVELTPDDKGFHLPAGGDEFLPNGNRIVYEDKVNLKFPAEYNIQALAVAIRSAMIDSTPQVLKEGEWHLPFIDMNEDLKSMIELDPGYQYAEYSQKLHDDLIRISAARCAMTSYNRNKGRSIETELDLAERLMKEHHWSPFEHQAQAVGNLMDDISEGGMYEAGILDVSMIPRGMEVRVSADGDSLWSRNFENWLQGRSLLD